MELVPSWTPWNQRDKEELLFSRRPPIPCGKMSISTLQTLLVSSSLGFIVSRFGSSIQFFATMQLIFEYQIVLKSITEFLSEKSDLNLEHLILLWYPWKIVPINYQKEGSCFLQIAADSKGAYALVSFCSDLVWPLDLMVGEWYWWSTESIFFLYKKAYIISRNIKIFTCACYKN